MADHRHSEFDDAMPLPADGELVTLRDVGDYIAKLPKREHDSERWQLAVKELLRATTDQVAWRWFARSAIMKALTARRRRRSDKAITS